MRRLGTWEMRGDIATPPADGSLRFAVAMLSLGAAWIHLAVTREHLAEFWLFGAFFATVAAVQAVWAIAVLLRPSILVYLGGVIVNAGIVAIWIASRTIGMPLGPEPWTPEPVGALDVLSTTLELLIIAGATKLILAGSTRRRAAQAAHRMMRFVSAIALALGAAMAVAFVLAFVIGLAGLEGHHH